MTFARRRIDLTFTLGKGTFGESGFDTVKVTGLRVRANISNAGSPSMGEANVRIYGLTLSMMNELSQVLRLPDGNIEVRFNQIIIDAGDDVSGMSTIFAGQTSAASIDVSDVPNASLMVSAHAGLFEALKSAPPVSYPGTADAAVIMQNLATRNGYTFENNGVSVILSTPYFQGTPRDQMMRCADAANINWVLDNGKLAIWPKGGTRGTDVIPLISPETGMIGYPANWQCGVAVRTVFNPQLTIGGICEVKSSLPFANGKYTMFSIDHELESELPDGSWFTQFQGSPFGTTINGAAA